MEEKNMRELNMDEMDKVSGGTGGELNSGIKFYEMDASAQWCAQDGYCPKCNPQRNGRPWAPFTVLRSRYHCTACGFNIVTA